MSETDSGTIASYLKENPRMMGALFTLVLLLSQAGSVAGAAAGTTSGP
jgi:hypothetical protein